MALEEYKPRLLINDIDRGEKVLASVVVELSKCDEFMISVAFITSSGVTVLLNTLSDLEQRCVKGRIIASQYQNFTDPTALKRLLHFKNIELRIVTEDKANMHTKGCIFRKGEEYSKNAKFDSSAAPKASHRLSVAAPMPAAVAFIKRYAKALSPFVPRSFPCSMYRNPERLSLSIRIVLPFICNIPSLRGAMFGPPASFCRLLDRSTACSILITHGLEFHPRSSQRPIIDCSVFETSRRTPT